MILMGTFQQGIFSNFMCLLDVSASQRHPKQETPVHVHSAQPTAERIRIFLSRSLSLETLPKHLLVTGTQELCTPPHLPDGLVNIENACEKQ